MGVIRTALALAALAVVWNGPLHAETFDFRVSLDTTPAHIRTKQIGRYLDALREKSQGRLNGTLFHSGQLFADRDVGKALRQNGIDMAVPGVWVLTGFEPNFDLGMLPTFFGRGAGEIHAIFDGEVGQVLDRSLEQKLRVKVIGKWLDLGAGHSYSARHPLNSLADLKGLKVRTSGGAGQFYRVKFFQGSPSMVPWPEVPLALSQGTFDALLSTNDTVVSAKLWEAGLKYALQDSQSFAQYVPMVSLGFWNKLPPDLQAIMTQTWAAMIDGFRTESIAAQKEAAETLAAHGVTVVTPAKDELRSMRAEMMATQEETARGLKLDPDLVAKARAALQAAD